MGREMKADATEAFRVIVSYPWGEKTFGPYGTLGAAKGAATREAGANYYRRTAVPFRIQRTGSDWVDVDVSKGAEA